MNSGFEALDIETVEHSHVFISVGFNEKKVPNGVKSVHFKFKIFVGIAIGIDENFEVVIVENNAVTFGKSTPDLIFPKISADIEGFIIPKHFHLSFVIRRGTNGVPFDILEFLAPFSSVPERLVETAVDLRRKDSTVANICSGLEFDVLFVSADKVFIVTY